MSKAIEAAIAQLRGLKYMLEHDDYPGGPAELLANVKLALKALRKVKR